MIHLLRFHVQVQGFPQFHSLLFVLIQLLSSELASLVEFAEAKAFEIALIVISD